MACLYWNPRASHPDGKGRFDGFRRGRERRVRMRQRLTGARHRLRLPSFLLIFVAAEAAWSALRKRRIYNLYDSPANLSIAGGVYYWYHRLSHQIPLLWTLHHTHHSSPCMNLTTAVRLNWIADFVSPFFFAPLILQGLSPERATASLALGLPSEAGSESHAWAGRSSTPMRSARRTGQPPCTACQRESEVALRTAPSPQQSETSAICESVLGLRQGTASGFRCCHFRLAESIGQT